MKVCNLAVRMIGRKYEKNEKNFLSHVDNIFPTVLVTPSLVSIIPFYVNFSFKLSDGNEALVYNMKAP